MVTAASPHLEQVFPAVDQINTGVFLPSRTCLSALTESSGSLAGWGLYRSVLWGWLLRREDFVALLVRVGAGSAPPFSPILAGQCSPLGPLPSGLLARAPFVPVRVGGGQEDRWINGLLFRPARLPVQHTQRPLCLPRLPEPSQHLIASINHPAISPESGKHFWGVQTPDFTDVSV